MAGAGRSDVRRAARATVQRRPVTVDTSLASTSTDGGIAISRRSGGVRVLVISGGTIALALAAGTATGGASAWVDPALEQRIEHRPGARPPVVVTMRAEVDARGRTRPALIRALRRTSARTQARAVRRVHGDVRRFWLINAFAARAGAGEVRRLAADPAVASVRLDRTVGVRRPRVGRISSSEPASGDLWGVEGVGASAVHARGLTGAGVTIGIIDTGVDAGHPALAGRVLAWRDFVGGRTEPYDDHGHGTHTLGTIVGGSSIGVAPGARAVVAKAMGRDGVGTGSALLAAAQWMTDPDGDPRTADHPDVVNNSWSAGNAGDPWFAEMARRWTELGILPVFAAGNTGPLPGSIRSPASYPEVLSVGAVDRSDDAPAFSARGRVDGDGSVKPDLAGPGVGITSSVRGGYAAYSGTSMAAPHVSGTAALVLESSPAVRGRALADLLRRSARDVGTPGPDPDTGYGVVDADAAVAAARNAGPETTLVRTPPAATRARSALYGVDVRNATGYRVRVDRGEWGPVRTDPRLRLRLGPGRNLIEVAAVRADGVADPTPAANALVVDRRKPRIAFGWRTDGGRLRLVARARDDMAGVAPSGYRWDLKGRATVSGRQALLRVEPATTGRLRARLARADGGGRTVSRGLARTPTIRAGVVVRLRVRDRAGNVATMTRRVPAPEA